MSYFLQNLVIALNDGSTYALIALGYTMVYGVLRLINFAHGDVFMLGAFAGAYCAYALMFNPGAWPYQAILYYVYGRAFSGLLVGGLLLAGTYFMVEWGSRAGLKSPRRVSVPIAIVIAALLAYFAFTPIRHWIELAVEWLGLGLKSSRLVSVPIAIVIVALLAYFAFTVTRRGIELMAEWGSRASLKSLRRISVPMAVGVATVLTYFAFMPMHLWVEQTSPLTDTPKQGIFDAFVGIVAAMVVCGTIGYCIERFAYRPLRRSPKLSSLITAIGVSLLIEYLAQIEWHFRGIALFGPSPLHFPPIAGTGDDIDFFTKHLGIRVNGKDLIVIGTCLLTLFILRFIVLHTRQGKAMRAVSLNYDSAQLMGININRVISFTFVLGSMLAALGGCLYGLNYEQCWPLMGLQLGLKAFVAAVIGGIGNIPGAAVGGFAIALIETFVSTIHYHNSAILGPYRDAIAFIILIAVLLVRPEGIFGKAVAEKV